MKLFLCGDVMTGRGIDQILAHPAPPDLHEPYIFSALGYVELAAERSGRIERPVDDAYIWGDAIDELAAMQVQARIINLETAVTLSEAAWPRKAVHYRMNPANVGCLTVAGIDCCVLANNHVLDWGYEGLAETLEVLHAQAIATAGAGSSLHEAIAPAVLAVGPQQRVLVHAAGLENAGVPREWAAEESRAGVSFLGSLDESAADALAARIGDGKSPGDIVIMSLHWGSNWGYEVSADKRIFAHRLIDSGAVDVVHGHSSHHPRPLEVYRGKPIFYGCGDFLNDYEGIRGWERYRPDLTAMYFLEIDPDSGELSGVRLSVMRLQRFSLHRASREDTAWLRETLEKTGRGFGVRFEHASENHIDLRW